MCQTRLCSKKKFVDSLFLDERFIVQSFVHIEFHRSLRFQGKKKTIRRNESIFVLRRLDGPWYCKKNPRAVYSLFVATRSRVITLEFETTLTPAAVPQFSNNVLPFSRTLTMSTQLPSVSGPWKTIRTFLFFYPYTYILHLSIVQSR